MSVCLPESGRGGKCREARTGRLALPISATPGRIVYAVCSGSWATETGPPGYESELFHIISPVTLGSNITSLSLRGLVCNGIIMAPAPLGWCEK